MNLILPYFRNYLISVAIHFKNHSVSGYGLAVFLYEIPQNKLEGCQIRTTTLLCECGVNTGWMSTVQHHQITYSSTHNKNKPVVPKFELSSHHLHLNHSDLIIKQFVNNTVHVCMKNAYWEKWQEFCVPNRINSIAFRPSMFHEKSTEKRILANLLCSSIYFYSKRNKVYGT